jgi:lanosterol synthase
MQDSDASFSARWDREGPSSDAYRLHKAKLRDFLWVSPEGMMVCGTNGSQLWDAAFIAQALFETGLATEPSNAASVAKLHKWLDDCQIKDNPKYMEEDIRESHHSFHRGRLTSVDYRVSDTTAEGLKAVMYLQSLP